MFGIWYDPEAKDEDIEKCLGDYIGCEVCIHKEKCFSFLKEVKFSATMVANSSMKLV